MNHQEFFHFSIPIYFSKKKWINNNFVVFRRLLDGCIFLLLWLPVLIAINKFLSFSSTDQFLSAISGILMVFLSKKITRYILNNYFSQTTTIGEIDQFRFYIQTGDEKKIYRKIDILDADFRTQFNRFSATYSFYIQLRDIPKILWTHQNGKKLNQTLKIINHWKENPSRLTSLNDLKSS
ncbi:hypothetical protein IW492_16410 [Enterococcus sp. BWB1-3]|uniref:hypothetical protein n=1 Tax=Enterococcus sp. BWB1-3 TaxID=2787713 RepID=UPI001921F3F2|nr:hypothetical protein [Enterococcus sp. BWB1-3]MBL1230812.1 hypothetical protein [Enterococcus sp. BWB1-3]